MNTGINSKLLDKIIHQQDYTKIDAKLKVKKTLQEMKILKTKQHEMLEILVVGL